MKYLYKIACTMHPNDIYAFLADNGADPWKSEPLTMDYLIEKLMEFIDISPENADLLNAWHECYNV